MKIVSVTSGKGGVGKTSIIANTAVALADRGYRVLILDGDLGMANVDLFFGVKSEFNIHHALTGEKELSEIIVPLARNIKLIPGGSGVFEFNTINFFHRQALIDSANQLSRHYDFMLIDTAPGISENVLYLNYSADQAVVVVTPDPASITDAYALIKVMHLKFKLNRFSILCNEVSDELEGVKLFEKFNAVSTRFLNISLEYQGAIPLDLNLQMANRQQRLIMKLDQNSPFATGINHFADGLEKLKHSSQLKGNSTLFWEQVIGQA